MFIILAPKTTKYQEHKKTSSMFKELKIIVFFSLRGIHENENESLMIPVVQHDIYMSLH